MPTQRSFFPIRTTVCVAMLLPSVAMQPRIFAQTAAPAPATPAATRQLGTVKAVSGDTITLQTDAGQSVTIAVPGEAKIMKLAPGSTDLKTAQPSQIGDIEAGDRILASVKAGDSPSTFTARTVVLMKSTDIAQKNAAEQAQWRANGTSGIVSSVDSATGAIVVKAGIRNVTINTSNKTAFKRFVGDSVKYQDAKPGTIAQIHAGDQLQARGEKSADGSSVQAEEVLSGSFKNLSGLIATVDPSSRTITLKDLATKKTVTVNVTPNSDIRKLPPQMAQMMATRTAGAGRAGAAGGGNGGGQAGQAGAAGQSAPQGSGGQAASGGEGQGRPGGMGGGMRRGGGDLSQMISRLPTDSLDNLTKGEAVMIVASEPSPGATTLTAVTVLTGVEPILTANPNGGVNLSGWSMGGEMPGAATE